VLYAITKLNSVDVRSLKKHLNLFSAKWQFYKDGRNNSYRVWNSSGIELILINK